MDRGAWWAAVHGVAKSRTRLSNFTLTFPGSSAGNGLVSLKRILQGSPSARFLILLLYSTVTNKNQVCSMGALGHPVHRHERQALWRGRSLWLVAHTAWGHQKKGPEVGRQLFAP